MIKKYIKILLCGIIVSSLLVGCGGKKETLSVQSNEEDLSANKKEQITISTYFPNDYLEETAKAFEKKYPDVSVTIHSYKQFGEDIQVGEGQVAPGEDLTPKNTLENYVTYLNTSLMSGEADDMLLLGWIPINKYVQSDYLVDLREMIETDNDLNDEAYYMNVIKGNTYNDIIYSMPMEFSFIMFGINEEAFKNSGLEDSLFQDDYWSISKMKELIELVPNRKNRDIYLQHGTPYNYFFNIFNLEKTRFVNMETKEINFDSEEFIQLLKECKEMESKNLLYTGDEEEKCSLFTGLIGGVRYTLFQPSYIGEGAGMIYIKPLINTKGEITLARGTDVSITKDAKNKELCWKFIKFMLSEKMQAKPELSGGYAVNKKAAVIERQEMIKQLTKELKQEKIKLKVSEEQLQSDLEKNIDKWTNMPTIYQNTYEIGHTIQEEVSPFFEGKKSAEEVAKTLQNKLYVMLNE